MPLADTIRPGCQGNDSSLTLSSRDVSHHGQSQPAAATQSYDKVLATLPLVTRVLTLAANSLRRLIGRSLGKMEPPGNPMATLSTRNRQ